MSKFFDPRTKTLHIVTSYVGAVKLPQDVYEHSERIDDSSPHLPRLRRAHAGITESVFFSTEQKNVLGGNFNLNCSTNADLVLVAEVMQHQ